MYVRLLTNNFLSEKAVGKSESKDVHLAVLRVLPEVIRESVDADASSKSVIIYDPATGEKKMVSPTAVDGIESLGEIKTAEQREAEINAHMQDAIQRSKDWLEGNVTDPVGMQIQLGDGRVATIEAMHEDGSSAIATLPDGTQFLVSKDVLHRIVNNGHYADYKARRDAEASGRDAEQSTESAPETATEGGQPLPEEASPKEEESREYAQGDVFDVVVDGNKMHAEIVSPKDADGRFVVNVDDGESMRTLYVTPEELAAMEYREEPSPKAEETRLATEDSSDKASERGAQPTEEHTPTALERIPRDEKGNAQFHDVDTETAWDGLVEMSGNEETAHKVAEASLANAERKLKAAKALKEKGETPEELLQSIKENEAAVAEAQREVDAWKAIVGEKSRREEAAKAEAERIATEKAEAERKAAEERERAEKEEKARIEAEKKEAERIAAEKAEEEARVEAERKERDENGQPFVVSSDGTTTFGEITEDTGLTAAPIKLSEGVADKKGNGYGLRHIEARHGDQIRKAGFSSVEEFVKYVASNYDKHNIKIGKKRANGVETYLIQAEDEHSNVLYVELSKDGSYWNVNSGGIFRKGYAEKKKDVGQNTEHPTSATTLQDKSFVQTDKDNGSQSADTHSDKQHPSADKGTTLAADQQTSDKESTKKVADSEGENTLKAKIEAASADVNTEPTEAQKEAGNYKKGHVQVGTFDITIEQPEGSIRRGTDADGKKWESKMHNTYGYFRGTEGVDGDHIDVFLSNDIDGWNGRKVFVVDQYNPDGTFDEHKVMLGFNDMDEAKSDYLANYEKGWENGRRIDISSTNLEDFEKWIDSSHRKTKPFSEYSSVNKETVATDKGGEKAEKKQKKQSVFDKAKEIADKEEKKRKAEAEDDSVLGQATRAVGKKKKVNLFKYTVSKKISISVLRGVHYANGYAYASDGYILFKEKADYPKEWEGTTRDKDGNLIDGKYPDTEKAIHRLVHIPDKEVESLPSKEVLDFAIAASKKLKGEAIPVAIDGLFFNAVNLKKFLEAVASKGMDKVVYRHPMLYATNGKDEIIMMPTVNTLEGALDIADRMESAGLPKEQIDAWKAHIEAADKKMSFEDFKKAVENAKKEGVDRSVRESRSEKTELTAEERELRDNLVERMRKGGLDVVTDSEEMQRVIDTENERTRNMFVGEKGATEADKAEEVSTRLDNLSVARRMEEVKKDAKTIKMATGWERGSDGKWRYETSDIKPKPFEEWMDKKDLKLGDIIDSDSGLFEMYPELKDFKVTRGKGKSTNAAIYTGLGKIEINFSKFKPYMSIPSNREKINGILHRVINHEIQHAIQDSEGFAQGVSPNAFRPDAPIGKLREMEEADGRMVERYNAMSYTEKALGEGVRLKERILENRKEYNALASKYRFGMDGYTRAAGEVEARNTEKRIGMTEEERRASLASETEDVAREDQILLGVDNADGEMNTGSVREHRVYHGSGADFDAFDHSHMGEGEGAQAYGWGTYVTEVEGIGRTYAVQNSKYAREYPVYNGDSHGLSEGRVNEILEVFLDGVSNEPYILRAWDDAMQWYSSRKDDDYAQSLVRDASLLNPSDISIAGSKTRNLYTVEIPDDNGSNYLDWDAPLPKGTIPRINEYLREKYGEDETVSARTCKGLYHQLERILGSDKKASQALAELGCIGIKYPADNMRGGREDGAKNYVIFKENDAKITAHTRFLRTAGGEVYGLVKDGRIYLDPKMATSETAVHEYTHLWGDMLRRKDSEQWSHTVKELKNSVLWEEVKESYPELKTDDEIADEVLSTFSGRRGAERLREEARRVADGEGGVFTKAKAIETLERVKEAIARFWEGVAKMFGINRYRSAEELADMAMRDLLDSKNPMKDESGMRERGEVGETLATSGTYFSGGGLLEAGLKGVIDPKVAVEFSEKIAGVYADNHGNHIVVADVRDVDPKKLVGAVDGGEVQYFHASPVCKNFSKAKREGGEVELDKETALSTAEFIAKTRPKVVTIENVKGYRNSEALKIITDELTRQGYDWDADVYNTADYGGYTKRERLIVRAKRDGKLPPKPEKLPEELRKKGWYSAVEDLIPHLEEKKTGVPQGTDERLKNSGIDYRTIDKPLYVFGRGYANKTVGHAFADELLPTLTTGGGDIIIMPDGRVLKASPRVLARVTGLPDTYKMPETDQLSHTIVGNGIPTQLTEGVIAPLLDNAIPSAERATKRESVFDVADRVSQNLEERTRAMAVKKANDRFNEELELQVKGELEEGHVYKLGMPSEILLSTGVPNLPIELSAKQLSKKAADRGHRFDVKDITNLPQAIQAPIAVFEYGNKDKSQNLIVEIERDGKKFVVGIHFNQNRRGIVVNDIRGLFNKDSHEWLNWISQGKLLYADKEKIQALIDKQRTNLAEVNYLNLDDVAKKVKDFENPKLFGEEIIDDGKKGSDSIDRSIRENPKNEDKPRFSRKPGESIFDYASRVSDSVDRSVRERVSARDEYEKKVKSKGFQTKEALQNSMLGLQEFMYAIDHASGNKRYIEDIPDFENPILGENRLSSVNKEEMHQVAKTQFKPLMSAVAKLSGNGKESGELYDYMFAKHGLERDAVMRQREAQKEFDKYQKANPKGTKTIGDFVASLEGKDYAGLTALTAEDGRVKSIQSQIDAIDEQMKATDDQLLLRKLGGQKKRLKVDLLNAARDAADDIRKAFESDPSHDRSDINELWSRVNEVNGNTLRKLYESGMLTKEAYNDISSMYTNYIPMRGFDQTTSADAYAYLTHGDSAFNAPIKTAKGRSSKADNPIAYMQAMAESAIMQGNRNVLVKQKMLNFVRNHPSDLASVSDVWLQYDSVADEWKPFYAFGRESKG